MRRRVHEITNDTDGLLVQEHILRTSHKDELWKRAALYDLVLVFAILESQRSQSARGGFLHLSFVRIQQFDERRYSSGVSHHGFDGGVLVREVRDGIRGAFSFRKRMGNIYKGR